MGRPAVFLDRDGTIIEEVEYLSRPEQVSIIDGAPEALGKLKKAGFALIVVTNQSGVARGYFTEEDVRAANNRTIELFREQDVDIDGVYYCPHLGNCNCRKPAAGMVELAMVDHGVDPAASFVVGDHLSDVGLAINVGARGILVRTGHGGHSIAELDADPPFVPHHIADSIVDAVEWILEVRDS